MTDSKIAAFTDRVLADAAHDIRVQRDANAIFLKLHQCFDDIVHFLQSKQRVQQKNAEHMGQWLDQYEQQAGRAYWQYHYLPQNFTRPGHFYGVYLFTFFGSQIFNTSSPYYDLRYALNVGHTSNNNGSFYKQTYDQSPLIVLNIRPKNNINPGKDGNSFFFDFIEISNELLKLRSVFVHEFAHFDEHMRSLQKTGGRGNQSRYPNHETNYTDYINDHREINARYSEWIFAILDMLNNLSSVQQNGIKGKFPSFQSFWHFFWTNGVGVPFSLKNHASLATRKRLARRLAKFYDFICRLPNLPPQVKVATFVQQQIESDPLAPTEVLSKYEIQGPRMGQGERPWDWQMEREVQDHLFPPAKPKPPAEPKKPPSPKSVKTTKPPVAKEKQPPSDDEDEPDAETEAKKPKVAKKLRKPLRRLRA